MKWLGVIVLLVVMIVSTRAQEDGACMPDLSGIEAELADALAFVEAGDSEMAMVAVARIRGAAQTIEARCDNSASESAGNSRTNPVPFGQSRHVVFSDYDGTVKVDEYIDDANDLVLEASRSNDEPETGTRYIVITITQSCDLSPDDFCEFSLVDFVIVGSRGIVYDWWSGGVSGLAEPIKFFGDGQITHSLAYLVDENDGDFVLFNQWGDEQVYFSTR